MRYWLCVTSPWNWLIVSQRNIWGVDYRYRLTLERYVKLGDILIFYVKGESVAVKKALREEEKVSKEVLKMIKNFERTIAGVYRVISPYRYDSTDIGWRNPEGKKYPYEHRVEIAPVIRPTKPIPLNQAFREELLFITDKSRSWTVFVFPSMTIIPEDDYQAIISKLKLT